MGVCIQHTERKIRGIQNNGVDVILFRTADGQEHLGRIEFEHVQRRKVVVYIVKSRYFGVHDEFGACYGLVRPNEVIRNWFTYISQN